MHKFTLVCAAYCTLVSCEAPKLATPTAPTTPARVLSVEDELHLIVVTFSVADIPYWVNLQLGLSEIAPGLHLVNIEVQGKTDDTITAIFYLVPTAFLDRYIKDREMKRQPQQQQKEQPRPSKGQGDVQSVA